MSSLRNPVGPQLPTVYWRRRLIVGLGAVAVLIIIILIIARPGSGGSKSPSAAPSPSATAGAAAGATAPVSASPAPVVGSPCVSSRITVDAVTDKNVYAAGVLPSISMTVTNTGSTPCSINLGSTQQELVITSGSETIWSSKDCQTEPVDTPTILKPNTPVSTPGIPWDRTRSSKATCTSARTPVKAAGASYHLTAKVGAIESAKTMQFILN